ncbi:acetamidase/formamidase family protein [bacterium]|nr:acetamidase/formamidase family protein [bacterium]
MKRITRKQANICDIDHRIEPAIRVEPGERFVLETEDAAAGYLRDEAVLPYQQNRPTHAFTPPLLNPVAGPVYIEGAEKGDLVAVSVEKIVPDSQGYTILQPGDGLFGDSLTYRSCTNYLTRILRHLPGKSGTLADGDCILNSRVRWKLAPFIGTMCLAPEREVPASVNVQGPWGGNLDSRDFCEGSIVYLNSYNPGGLLFAGDVHGSQGDGELSGTANEVRAEITLSCTVIKQKKIPHVRVEKPDSIIGLSCGKPLENAVRGAVVNLLEWMKGDYGFDEREAYLLIGTCPDVRINIYQMVDLLSISYTAGVEVPKSYIM